MRALKAFLIAPVPAVIVFLLWLFGPEIFYGDVNTSPETFRSQFLFFLSASLVVAYALVVLFGVPLYLILRALRIENALVTILLAALVGAGFQLVPELLRILTVSEGSTFSSRIGSCESVIDNVRTRCGYALLLRETAVFALFGAFAGTSFWLAYKAAESIRLSWILAGFALVGVFVSLAVYATVDRSCHNMFRDGRTSIGPEKSFYLELSEEEWPDLTASMELFAERNNLSFRDRTVVEGSVAMLHLSVCSEEGFNIQVHNDPIPRNVSRVRIYIYLMNESSAWEITWEKLKTHIAGRWEIFHEAPSE